MKIAIQNQKLAPAINFLTNIKIKDAPTKSRHRTHFVNRLREMLKQVAEDEQLLLKEECNLDENGDPKEIEKNGQLYYDVKDKDHFKAEKKKLYEEERVIDGGDDQVMMQTVKKLLDNYKGELFGEKADIHDYLCTQFEKAEK